MDRNQLNITDENKRVILNSIIASNQDILKELNSRYPDLTEIEFYTVLLRRLKYTLSESRIILGISEEKIKETLKKLEENK